MLPPVEQIALGAQPDIVGIDVIGMLARDTPLVGER